MSFFTHVKNMAQRFEFRFVREELAREPEVVEGRTVRWVQLPEIVPSEHGEGRPCLGTVHDDHWPAAVRVLQFEILRVDIFNTVHCGDVLAYVAVDNGSEYVLGDVWHIYDALYQDAQRQGKDRENVFRIWAVMQWLPDYARWRRPRNENVRKTPIEPYYNKHLPARCEHPSFSTWAKLLQIHSKCVILDEGRWRETRWRPAMRRIARFVRCSNCDC